MTPSRESIADALATLLGGAEVAGTWPSLNPILVSAGYKLFGRRLRIFSRVDASEKPCLFLVNYNENHERAGFTGPDKRTMGFMLVIMDDVSDPGVIPSRRANALLDAIDDVFRSAISPMTGLVTLGGVVSHAWVEGAASISVGDVDSQTVITYPIRVLCP